MYIVYKNEIVKNLKLLKKVQMMKNIFKKIFNMLSHQGNANQKYIEIIPHPS